MTSTDDARRDAMIVEIAKRELGIGTLERRWSDSLDFHDLAVWNVKSALEAAYEAGRDAERRRRIPARCRCPACGRTVEISRIA